MSSTDGKAGAIREGGGAFGKIEAAREEEYFLKTVRSKFVMLTLNIVFVCEKSTRKSYKIRLYEKNEMLKIDQ